MQLQQKRLINEAQLRVGPPGRLGKVDPRLVERGVANVATHDRVRLAADHEKILERAKHHLGPDLKDAVASQLERHPVGLGIALGVLNHPVAETRANLELGLARRWGRRGSSGRRGGRLGGRRGGRRRQCARRRKRAENVRPVHRARAGLRQKQHARTRGEAAVLAQHAGQVGARDEHQTHAVALAARLVGRQALKHFVRVRRGRQCVVCRVLHSDTRTRTAVPTRARARARATAESARAAQLAARRRERAHAAAHFARGGSVHLQVARLLPRQQPLGAQQRLPREVGLVDQRARDGERREERRVGRRVRVPLGERVQGAPRVGRAKRVADIGGVRECAGRMQSQESGRSIIEGVEQDRAPHAS